MSQEFISSDRGVASGTVPGFNRIMEMVTDFGVESLRVGSYEARKPYGTCDEWKLSMLRDKRQEARERIAKALWEAFAARLGADTNNDQPKGGA